MADVKRKKNTRKSNCKRKKKWFDKDCQALLTHVRKLGRQLSTRFSQETLKAYHDKKKEFFRLRNHKNRKYVASILENLDSLHSSNPAAYWKLFNKLKNFDKVNSKCPVRADDFLKYFKSLYFRDSNSEQEKIYDQFIQENQASIFNELNYRITEGEVSNAIKNLKNNKASGLDLILNEMMRFGQVVFTPVICKIFNDILTSGTFPESWRCNILTPIHKKGTTTSAANYRGIAVSSNFCKLFCTILHSRLSDFCDKHEIIPHIQIGYRKHCRTSDHVFVLKGLIDKYVRRGKWLYTCFVDFRAAFDSVSRKALLYKLIRLGIGGNFLSILKAMYSNVSYCIKLNGKVSTSFLSNSGVKQGCVLSPLLFNMFLSDLPKIFDDSCAPVGVNGGY